MNITYLLLWGALGLLISIGAGLFMYAWLTIEEEEGPSPFPIHPIVGEIHQFTDNNWYRWTGNMWELIHEEE